MQILHNPRCSKSREALDILKESGQSLEVVEYLKAPPTAAGLTSILEKLAIKAEDLVRKGEDVYKQKYAGRQLTEKEWIDAMVENPILIERPIVVRGNKAVIGRPPERVKELL